MSPSDNTESKKKSMFNSLNPFNKPRPEPQKTEFIKYDYSGKPVKDQTKEVIQMAYFANAYRTRKVAERKRGQCQSEEQQNI